MGDKMSKKPEQNKENEDNLENITEDFDDSKVNWREKALEAIGILKKLSKPPLTYATFLGFRDETQTAEIATADGSLHIVNYNPRIKDKLNLGDTVNVVPGNLAIVKKDGAIYSRTPASISEVLKDGRVQIDINNTKKIIKSAIPNLKVGDSVLTDNSTSIVVEYINNNTKGAYKIDKVPNVPWSAVGGLEDAIIEIKKQIETPLIHKDIYDKFPNKKPIKGALLYGPPGCGKTLIAKAIAYNMALQRKECYGGELNGFFMNVSGPEFLQKYVGVGESKVREMFAQARETALEHNGQVVLFIDEGESVFKKRGTGISSDATDTLVQEFLYQMDGMKSNDDVLVLLASNRPELLDPAVVRPGRIDRKIYVGRPNEVGAEKIFEIYLKDQPLEKTGMFKSPESQMIDFSTHAARQIYGQYLPMLDIFYKTGEKVQLEFKHVFSGATAVSVVGRATDFAIDRAVKGGDYRLTKKDVSEAVMAEYIENKDIANLVTDYDIKSVTNGRHKDVVDIQKAGYNR
jgi:proteasome-associated ATPase